MTPPTLFDLTRPDLAHVPDLIWPIRPDDRDIQIEFDLKLGGRYVTAECQLGAHHACPGGLFSQVQEPMPGFKCRCIADGCSCNPVQELVEGGRGAAR